MNQVEVTYENHTLFLKGSVTVDTFADMTRALNTFSISSTLTINCQAVTAFDTAGGILLRDLVQKYKARKVRVFIREASPKIQHIMERVNAIPKREYEVVMSRPKGIHLFLHHIGQAMARLIESVVSIFSFLGISVVEFFRALRTSMRVLIPHTLFYMSKAGVRSIPIIVVTSFVVGIVISYEGIIQLAKFGAELTTITLISFSVLREGGVLSTAIVIAGRSGSAFAAEIGAMRVNEEIDALRLMGVNPIQFLVLPRLIALFIFMPILTVVADIFGLLGGALICMSEIEIGLVYFFLQLKEVTAVETFLIGLGKAPFFGILIAIIGCMEGMNAQGSAASVGYAATKSVVKSIFLVIILNSVFSILFAYLRIRQ